MKKRSALTKLLFSIVALVLLTILVEVGFRIYFYTATTNNISSLPHFFGRIQAHTLKFQRDSAIETAKKFKNNFPSQQDIYLDPEHSDTLKQLEQDYAKRATAFSKFCQSKSFMTIVMYIPSAKYSRSQCRSFFEKLYTELGMTYWDLTDNLEKHDMKHVTLHPWNGHLSRYGCRLVANEMQKKLSLFLDYRSTEHFPSRPSKLADLNAYGNELWDIVRSAPYRVKTNNHGFRSLNDMTFPKPVERSRILIVGDSFAFGPYLPNQDTFPELLDTLLGNADVYNASIPGFTICDQHSYLVELGQYCEPDIVIVQILDNDIYGLMPHKLKEFSRTDPNKYLTK